MAEHHAGIRWTRTTEDFAYESYNRNHEVRFPGVTVPASAAPGFHGDAARMNPEEAFVAALSSCHMLSFLAIAARKRLTVDSYSDDAVGYLEKNEAGRLAITRVSLRPRVVWGKDAVVSAADVDKMHHLAHQECFIANSVKTDVRVDASFPYERSELGKLR